MVRTWLNVVYYPRLLEYFRAANEAALLSRVNMEATILVFQGCISPLAFSYCRISADSGANKSSNHGTGSLVAEGHHRCFDWFSTRLEGVFLGEYEVACERTSRVRACSLSKCTKVFE